MSRPNTHFNPSSNQFEQGRKATSRPNTSQGAGFTKPFWRDPVGQAAAFATLYGLHGFFDLQSQNEMYGTPEAWPIALAFIGLMVWLPAVLMYMRKGYISAASLCLPALMNCIGIWDEVSAGNELFHPSSILWHAFAMIIFARATWSNWSNRSSKN